jgi:hypothetical protein
MTDPKAAAAADPAAAMSAMMQDAGFKALLANMINTQAASVAAEAIAAAKAETAAAVKAGKKAKPVSVLPALAFVDREVKKDKNSGDTIVGKGAGFWPAKFAVMPEAWRHKNRPEWVNPEIVRTVLDNAKLAAKILAEVDAANKAASKPE